MGITGFIARKKAQNSTLGTRPPRKVDKAGPKPHHNLPVFEAFQTGAASRIPLPLLFKIPAEWKQVEIAAEIDRPAMEVVAVQRIGQIR